MLNHNIETVARLQRAVRPSASYARSLAVLARAKAAGLTTKSGLILGMGETDDEVVADPGRPARRRRRHRDHRPVPAAHRPTTCRWRAGGAARSSTGLAEAGEALGIAHVEACPLTRSSYHARQAVGAASEGVTWAAPNAWVRRRLLSGDGHRSFGRPMGKILDGLDDDLTPTRRAPTRLLRGHGAARATAAT